MSAMWQVKKIRLILLCISVCIIGAVLVIALKGEKKQIVIKENTRAADNSPGATIELKNVAYSTTNKDNFKEWDLNAQSAQYYQGGETIILEGVEVKLYRPDGSTYSLKGAHGEYNTETKNIKMYGNIIGVMPDNTTVQAETFYYDNAKRQVTTNDTIFIKRSNFTLKGRGMVIDLNKEKLSILSHVKALGSR